MASKALHDGILDSKQLMSRLRVTQLATVRRYGKTGKLQRQMAILGKDRRVLGESMMSATSANGNPLLALIARLASLKRMRLDRNL